MKGVSVLFFLGLCTPWICAVFLNHRPFPTYSLENMPSTTFSCRDKILGGYYADAETQCQMFHICVKVAGIGVQDFRFLCPNGTAFDQDHQICAEWEDIDCDATTLYYSSDNFDLYRIGSGFESKAHRYGEDEETFSLQRAETGDARINHEQQTKIVDQTKAPKRNFQKTQKQNFNNNNNNNDKDIFKGSSSSNFYNNRNNGKERDEDYDDNVNINQNQQYEQRRKVVRNKVRRPAQNNQNNNRERNSEYARNQNNDYSRKQNNQYDANNNYNRNQNSDNKNYNNNNNNRNQEPTRKPANQYTGFANNFAGSYEPTTTKPSSTTLNAEQYTTAINNYRSRNGQRRQQTSEYTDSPVYTISTPAPFKQYNAPPSRSTSNTQYTSAPSKATTNNFDISKVKPSTSTTAVQDYSTQYDVPKVKAGVSTGSQYNTQKTTVSQYETTKVKQTFKTTPFDKTENYPSNNPKYSTSFDKKPTTAYKQTDNYPTTLSPKPFSVSNNFPTTFAPRTNAAYSQIAQQTNAYNQNRQNTQNGPSSSFGSTPKSTPFTQYTPTVPKLSSTTPVSRSGRFDETSYDDGSYNTKYDYDGDGREDEFLKTANSQNIAASRNELQRTTNNKQTQTTVSVSKPTHDVPKINPSTAKANKDVPKTSAPTSRATEPPKTTSQAVQKKPVSTKKDYDYAYYDSGVGSEPDYEIDTEIKKSTVKN